MECPKCSLKAGPKLSFLLLIVLALVVLGFQFLALLPRSSVPTGSSSAIEIGFQEDFASPDMNMRSNGFLNQDIIGDGGLITADGLSNASVSSSALSEISNEKDGGGSIVHAAHQVGGLEIFDKRDPNRSIDLVSNVSARLKNYSKLVASGKNGKAAYGLHMNLSVPIQHGYGESSLIDRVGTGFSRYPDWLMLQNSSATLWSMSPEEFELVLNRARGAPSMPMAKMNVQLEKNLASPPFIRPSWHLAVDKQILSAKAKIQNTSSVQGRMQKLYPYVFRNISLFKRSYELMEQTLKVYIYPDGEKPVFHQPDLRGIYASEGWFMKLMQESRFLVENPWKAHLFYMPFSSSTLRYTQGKGLHSKRKLFDYLKDYLDLIARKYPFWNRTGGVDHFLVACHDWAPYMTQHMSHCIRTLCNADVSQSFELGKDVSLPETNIRLQDPSINIGGRPANERSTLAFFTGVQNGYLRRFLFRLWENKDPAMNIFRAPSRHSLKRTEYAEHMRVSKYCICPRGHHVNSPRVIEAILYECVPVIISDNFVPPFFEVLDWTAFSVFVPEKDIRRLKEILLAIPARRYLLLQKGVRKVQQHFLWHAKLVKYDMFDMLLHSVWLSRLNRIELM